MLRLRSSGVYSSVRILTKRHEGSSFILFCLLMLSGYKAAKQSVRGFLLFFSQKGRKPNRHEVSYALLTVYPKSYKQLLGFE